MQNIDIEKIAKLSQDAGQAILEVYKSKDFWVERKEDKSPVTEADMASHHHIKSGLAELYPDIPLCSEESDFSKTGNIQSNRFWLVDPLDGTKEFLKRTGEFTVNIALIEDNKTVLAAVYLPATDETYYASHEHGAWYSERGATPKKITTSVDGSRCIALVSRSHREKEEEKLKRAWPHAEVKSAGSSLKFCRIASGDADIYIREGRTMGWDTAAAHCIVESAGGRVFDFDGKDLTYSFGAVANPSFVVIGNPDMRWQAYFDAS